MRALGQGRERSSCLKGRRGTWLGRSPRPPGSSSEAGRLSSASAAAQRRAGPDKPGLRRAARRRTRVAMAEEAPVPVSAPARTPSPARPPTPPPRGPARVSVGRPERPARRLRPGPRFGPSRAVWPPSSASSERPGGPNARPGAAGGRPRRRGTGRAF